jgi:hypothetical protein
MAHPFEAEFWVAAKEENKNGHGASAVALGDKGYTLGR